MSSPEPSLPPDGSDDASADRFAALVTPEKVGDDRFRIDVSGMLRRHLFGGVVAAQSLHVASTTVEVGRQPHSAHAYFLRRGDPGRPIDFEVHRDTDGRGFSARRVAAIQDGAPIFTMVCSFQVPADSEEHLSPMPTAVPDPLEMDLLEHHAVEGYLEVRYLDRPSPKTGAGARTQLWVRANGALPDDPVLHDCLRFCASDMGTPWGVAPVPGRRLVSLDHAIWSYQRSRMDEWHLLELEPHAFSSGRGFYTGRMWHHDGDQVASMAQEVLLR